MKNFLKKMAFVFFSIAITATVLPINAYASTIPETVRVGLEAKNKKVTNISIGNSSIILACHDKTGDEKEYIECANLSSASGFKVSTGEGFYLKTSDGFEKYDQALNKALELQSQGYRAYPAMVGVSKWAVFISEYTSYSAASNDSLNLNATVVEGMNVLKISGDEGSVFVFGTAPRFIAGGASGVIKIGDRSYRDQIEIVQYPTGDFTPVNVVDFDTYLYSVVPSEMPHTYALEALKAQACAARTYAVERMNAHTDFGYDLCDTTSCQVYGGSTHERESTNRAVDETTDKIIYYKGKPIKAVFFASSGGYTDDAVNVWAYDIEYLKAVPDIYETEGNKWTKTYTLSDIDKMLAVIGANIGLAQNMEITRASSSGRVQELQITGTSGVKTITKESIKSFFNPVGGSLLSRMFTIKTTGSTQNPPSPTIAEKAYEIANKESYIIGSDAGWQSVDAANMYAIDSYGNKIMFSNLWDAIGRGTERKANAVQGDMVFTIEGSGSGHGVGMSQNGANGMAAEGYNYIDILKHYYTGVTIE